MSLSRAPRLAISAALGTGMALTAMLPAAADDAPTESLISVGRTANQSQFLTYTSAGTENITLDVTTAHRLLVSVHSSVLVKVGNGGGCSLSYQIFDDYLFDCGTVSNLEVDVTLGAGNDTIRWNLPVVGTVRGGAGNDTFLPAPGFRTHVGADSVDMEGGTGEDTVDFRHSITGVVASLDKDTDNDGRRFIDTNRINTDVENLSGSRYNDSLAGDSSRNILTGGSGPDQIFTRGGSDAVNVRDGYGDQVFCPVESPAVTFNTIDEKDTWVNCTQNT